MIGHIFGSLLVASKESALKKFRTELSIGSCVVKSRQSAGQNQNMLTANKSSENVVKFRNCMQEEIKNRLRVLPPVRARLVCFFVFFLFKNMKHVVLTLNLLAPTTLGARINP